jgi:hypothetical protein
VWKGGSTTENEAKTQEKWNTWASSRRLVFVGRLHTSATSPLMKASRNGSKQAPAPVPAPGSKGQLGGFKKGFPGTISSSNYGSWSLSGCLLGSLLGDFEAIEAGKVPPGFFRKYKKVPPGFFRKYKNPSSENIRTLYYVVSLWNTIIIRKNENPGLTDKSRFWSEISSQIHFSTENLISSYGHDEHFGKGVCPKPILKVWFWMKAFSMSM